MIESWSRQGLRCALALAVLGACDRHAKHVSFGGSAEPRSLEHEVGTASKAITTRRAAQEPEGAPPFETPQTFVVRPNEEGSISVDFGATSLARPKWVFWGSNWKWADTRTEPSPGVGAAFSTVRGRTRDLGLSFTTTYSRGEGRRLQAVLDIAAAADVTPAIGGGIEFVLRPHPAMLGEPTILPGGAGWTWAAKGGGELRVQFVPPLPQIYAERGDRYRLRCMLFAGSIPRGQRRQSMTVDLPPAGVVQTRAEPPYAAFSHGWAHAFDLQLTPDVSFLNAAHGPAGSHGRLLRRGHRLTFADGTEARFWGTNLPATVLFTGSDADVATVARRLSSLGFNLVRLHHHDSSWVKPNIFAPGADTRTIDGRALAALGRWVRALKEQGIYTWVDIHVGRKFKIGDNIRGFAEVDASDSRGFDYVNADLVSAHQDFARQYLTRKNPHTGLSFAEDPAVVAFLVTNENDLTHHFGNKMLRAHPTPVHTAMLEALASSFSARTGIPRARLLRTWEPGPAKLFLNDVEHQAFVRWRSFLAGLGVNALLAMTSTWGGNPIAALPSLTAGDIVDVHNYGTGEFLSTDPRTTETFVHWLAAAQVDGYPLSVTEWNVTWPIKDRFCAPIHVASVAALQGWDMVLHYAYLQHTAGRTRTQVDRWTSADDPALMTQMPAAALLYRRADVAEARRTYRLELDSSRFYGTAVSPDTSAALRTLAERSRVVVGIPDSTELAWDALPRSANATVVSDPDASFLTIDATEVVSDTGQLVRNWVRGYQLIKSARTQGASGWLGARKLDLGAVTLALDTRKAAVVVSSLDDLPIETSGRLLVSVTAQAASPGNGALPLLSEPVTGELRMKTQCRCARRLTPTGTRRAEELPVEGGQVLLTLKRNQFAHWYLLERPPPRSTRCQPASE